MSLPLTFHPYEHDALHDDPIAPPALSTKRASRLSAPFPTFLYASEPPPVTARNKQRVRPTASQLAELKALYAASPHPPRDVREALGRKIGMRYQSVTNWFQNQRSTAKKRVADLAPAAAPPHIQSSSSSTSRSRSRSGSRSRMSSPGFGPQIPDDDADDDDLDEVPRGRSRERHAVQSSPPRARQRADPVKDIIVAQAAARQQQLNQLPLPLSGSTIVPTFSADHANNSTLHISLPPAPRTTSVSASAPSYSRAPTSPLLSAFQVSRTQSPNSIINIDTAAEDTYNSAAECAGASAVDQVPRGKRSRPTPHQLAALRALHALTSSPTIEERTRVGHEIGMELGKVTNWFRNLRQTARKKERRALQAEGSTIYPSKRARHDEFTSAQRTKRPRLNLDEDEDDNTSLTTSHAQSGAFDTSSTVGSMDLDFEYERPDAQPRVETHIQPRRWQGNFRRDEMSLYQLSTFDDRPESPPPFVRRRDHRHQGHEHDHDHDHDHDHELRSEQGTESDAHEAVTPEPQGAAVPDDNIPTAAPHLSTPTFSPRGSPSPTHRTDTHPTKHASVDDAMLLLAFHSAHT